MINLGFESTLSCSPETAWSWITSVQGISKELRPYLRMTTPHDVRRLSDIQFVAGQRLFRSYVLLFGILPIDFSDLTLIELNPMKSFKEESPMGSMRFWRHERSIVHSPGPLQKITIKDQLTFVPRFAPKIVAWFIHQIFTHRHRVLRAGLGNNP